MLKPRFVPGRRQHTQLPEQFVQQRIRPERVSGRRGGSSRSRRGPRPTTANVQHGGGGPTPELRARHQPRRESGKLAGPGRPLRQRVHVQQRRRPHQHEPRELDAQHEQSGWQHTGPADKSRRVRSREPHLVPAGPDGLQLDGAHHQHEHRQQHGHRRFGDDLQAHQVLHVAQTRESLPGRHRRVGQTDAHFHPTPQGLDGHH